MAIVVKETLSLEKGSNLLLSFKKGRERGDSLIRCLLSCLYERREKTLYVDQSLNPLFYSSLLSSDLYFPS